MKNIVLAFAEMVGVNGVQPRYELKIVTIDSPVDMLNSSMKAYVTYLGVTDLSVVLANCYSFQPILPTVDTLFPASHFSEVLDKAIAQVDFDFLISNTPSLEVYQLDSDGTYEYVLVIANNLKVESRSPDVRFLHHSFNQLHFMNELERDPKLQHLFKEIDNKQIPISR